MWTTISTAPASITANTTDAVEGDSSFEFNVLAGTEGGDFVYGDYIPVDPRLTYLGSISVKLVTGAGDFSAGYEAFDAARVPLPPNTGDAATYFIARNSVLTLGVWTEFLGLITGEGPGQHQFPVGTRFIRPVIVTNHNGVGITRVDAFRISLNHPIRTIARWQGYAGDEQDNGALPGRTVTVTKLAGASSGLRVTWNDNFRVMSGSNWVVCQWEVLFNGAACTNPGRITYALEEANANHNQHFPTTVSGTCFGLPAGQVTVSTRVGPLAGYNAGDCFTGFGGLTSLEVEEVL